MRDARRGRPALLHHLLVDRVRHHHQVVHRGRQPPELLLVLAGADAGRVDRGHHPRPAVARLAQRDRGLRPHDLRAVHVVVDHVRPGVREVGGQDAGGDGVVRLVDDHGVDAVALQLADRAAGRERDDGDVVEVAVQPRDQVEHVLLGAAVGAGGHDLDHAHALAARARARWTIGATQGSSGLRAASSDPAFAGRAGAGLARPRRPTRTCRARRRAGSPSGAMPRSRARRT